MSKKKPLSDEQRAECAEAMRLFLSKKNELRLSQRKVADELGISPAAVAMYLNGVNPLNAKFAAAFSALIGVPVSAFSPRLAGELSRMAQSFERSAHETTDKDDNVITADFSRDRVREGEIDIPQYDVRGSMGAGQVMPSDYIETVKHITVSLQYLREQGVTYSKAGNLSVITGFGESMNRTFSSGDPLIIDQGVTSVVTDGVYLFSISGSLFVKRLQILPSGIRVISDNEAYPPYDITGPDLKNLTVHARVLLAWRSQRL